MSNNINTSAGSHWEFAPPQNFLGLDDEHSALETSGVVVLPIPYELTTSYGQGTRNGPRALLHASLQVELYDREFGGEPALGWGVHTLPALAANYQGPEAMQADIAAAVAEYARSDKLVFVIGGEHSISGGVARGLHAVHGPFVTVQLDAHADLRDEYEGTPYSHASAMRRVIDNGGGRCYSLASVRSAPTKPPSSANNPNTSRHFLPNRSMRASISTPCVPSFRTSRCTSLSTSTAWTPR